MTPDSVKRPARRAQRIPWDTILEDVHRRYPSTADDAWADSLRDYEMLGNLVGGLLRVESKQQDRRGQRPVLTDADRPRLRLLVGDDYSTLPFPQAFASIAGSLSRTQLARKTGLPRTHVHRLLSGEIMATATDMEAVAKAFHKPPTFFADYRRAVIVWVVDKHLEGAPESTVTLIKQLERT